MSADLSTNITKQLTGSVLVVDDNEINRFFMKKLLMRWGISVDFAENGEIAVSKVQSNKYNLVLMDIHMPVLNGTEAASTIRKCNNGQFADLPIIALTASILQDDINDIYESGMNDYIAKPFNQEDLYQKLATIINKQVI